MIDSKLDCNKNESVIEKLYSKFLENYKEKKISIIDMKRTNDLLKYNSDSQKLIDLNEVNSTKLMNSKLEFIKKQKNSSIDIIIFHDCKKEKSEINRDTILASLGRVITKRGILIIKTNNLAYFTLSTAKEICCAESNSSINSKINQTPLDNFGLRNFEIIQYNNSLYKYIIIASKSNLGFIEPCVNLLREPNIPINLSNNNETKLIKTIIEIIDKLDEQSHKLFESVFEIKEMIFKKNIKEQSWFFKKTDAILKFTITKLFILTYPRKGIKSKLIKYINKYPTLKNGIVSLLNQQKIIEKFNNNKNFNFFNKLT